MSKAPLRFGFGLAGTLCALSIAAALPDRSAAGDRSATGASNSTFEVTVTNLTRAQVFSPLLVATHGRGAAFFTVGEAASPELAALAEDGDNAPLMSVLQADAAVANVVSGAGPLPPGASETIFVESGGLANQLSLAGMLVNTNDAFVALDAVRLPTGHSVELFALAFDAGSEFNSESCDYIPGPACGAGPVHDPVPAEGYVYVSNGIHGVGDLAEDVYDWHNPVARVEIRRVAGR